jgi:pimeloyl-ACP methyl ester carboxylesterase
MCATGRPARFAADPRRPGTREALAKRAGTDYDMRMIHALPGMGADHRMYPDAWSVLPDFAAHDWIRHADEKTLPDVAQSMCLACNIRDGDTLIGSSLGGMVACEIAKIRDIHTLFLVGSAVCKDEVNRLLAALHPLARATPIEWLQFSAGKVPVELVQMFSTMEPSFIRAMCEAVFQWEGLGQTRTPVVRIHGKFDLVIPPPAHPDLLVNGGHLISITHARECAEFVRRRMRAGNGLVP